MQAALQKVHSEIEESRSMPARITRAFYLSGCACASIASKDFQDYSQNGITGCNEKGTGKNARAHNQSQRLSGKI
jgi:hypothetical protein